jgi:hypothetical protein
MKKSRFALLPVVVLAIAACGSDDGGASLTDDQQAAVEQFLGQEDAAEVFDQDCVEDKAQDLSDEDAKAIAEAGPDGQPDLSPEGLAVTLELASCIDSDALVDQFIIGMEESGQDFDEACVREGLEDFDMGEIAAAGAEGGDIPDGLLSSLIDCFEFELGS